MKKLKDATRPNAGIYIYHGMRNKKRKCGHTTLRPNRNCKNCILRANKLASNKQYRKARKILVHLDNYPENLVNIMLG